MTWERVDNWFDSLLDRFRGENDEIRREEREGEPSGGGEEETHVEESNEIDDLSPPIKIVAVELLAKSNAASNNCAKFELVQLTRNNVIVRRAGTFRLKVKLNQTVDIKRSQRLTFTFGFGPRPNIIRGTEEVLQVGGKTQFELGPQDDWDSRVVETEGTTVTVEIQVGAAAPVGVWRLRVTATERGAHTFVPSPSSPTPPPQRSHVKDLAETASFYVLFNPWSKHDQVYMSNDEHRKEYVLADVGKIWVGNYPSARGRSWVFGQFDDAVLPACVLMLEKAGVIPENRGDPILVSRAISRIVNSNDDRGVVVGRWKEPYDSGTAPTGWTGSIKILEEYVRKGRPVRYGQCWVFSGVVTTVCRALGLPCRSVSNLNSAHDTNASLTIDEYYDDQGEDYSFNPDKENPTGLGDSIWNFHVWNDVWMSRPDLPGGYGGWQAIDATPQETSAGFYQCGPASLEAVRRGQVTLPYDVQFVLAEVNADKIRWKQDPTAKNGFKKLSTDKTSIGRQLLTKLPGILTASSSDAGDREDCTTDYKAPEGTDTERVTLYGAARHLRSARHAFRFPSVAEMDVDFELVKVDSVNIGDDYGVAIKMKNTSDSVRTVSISLASSSEHYTGVKAHVIRRAEGTFALQPEEEETLQLPVTYQDYIHRLVEHGVMKILAIANVKETTQSWIDDDKFTIVKPELDVKAPPTAVIGAPILVRISFTNPMEEPLTKAFLVVDGPGLTRPKRIPVADIPPKSLFSHSMRLYSKRAGTMRSLVVTFGSKQLTDLMGSATIDITDQED